MNSILKILGKLSAFIISFIIVCHSFAIMFFIPYYNWQYIKNNGVAEWLLFGEIIPTAKAFAWPYFVFFSSSILPNNFINSLNYANEANEFIDNVDAFTIVDPEDMDKIIELYKKAIEKAVLVDINQLNNKLNNFGNHYRDEFIKGLKLTVEGYEKHDNTKYMEGNLLLYNWGEWYTANIDNIKNNGEVETVPYSAGNSPMAKRPPDFNASEIGRYSKILSKSVHSELNEEDLKILRSVMSDYTSRTGRRPTKDEHEFLIEAMKLTNDYNYELGQSMLFSWDSEQHITTTKFDDLYKVMKTMGSRKDKLLKNDTDKIRAASQNQYYITDESGAKYEFSREIILEGIDANNLARQNFEKISLVIKDFVQ
ncbi:MAG: hypothetical protein GY864_05960 [Desulfobacterales bacterium]|nr:hypothetical protein [Desulfobacterales bacterium]